MKRGIPAAVIIAILGSVASDSAQADERMRNEWFASEASPGGPVIAPERTLPVTWGHVSFFRIATLRWRHLYLTAVELGAGLLYTGRTRGGDVDVDLGGVIAYIGTKIGMRFLVLGARQQHQLMVGLGVGGGLTWSGDFPFGLMLSPTVRYKYQTNSRFFLGAGVRALVAVCSDQGIYYGGQVTPFLFFMDFGLAQAAVATATGKGSP